MSVCNVNFLSNYASKYLFDNNHNNFYCFAIIYQVKYAVILIFADRIHIELYYVLEYW